MPEWKQDESGQWWCEYSGRRYRGEIRTCNVCEVEFKARPSDSTKTCSRACSRVNFSQKARGRSMAGRTHKPRPCSRCGEEFQPNSGRHKFCSEACKRGTNTCEQCGGEFTPAKNSERRFCSAACFYERAYPTGSRRVEDSGYVVVKVPEGTLGTKRSETNSRWMFEHRYVMQQTLGRPLADDEQVHHLNGDKQDNRPENLELWLRNQPTGIRAKDERHCPTCTCVPERL